MSKTADKTDDQDSGRGPLSQYVKWRELAVALPLLAGISYIIGRFAVDGFYEGLDTTAEDAGIGYPSILEPAAFVLVAVAVAVGLIWAIGSALIPLIGLGRARVVAGALLVLLAAIFFEIDELLVISSALAAAIELVIGARASPEQGAEEDRAAPPGASPGGQAVKHPRKGVRALILLAAVGIVVGTLFGAHQFGVIEASHARKGHAVDFNLLGVHVPSITAAPVIVTVVGQSPEFAKLITGHCFLALGTPGLNTALFDWQSRQTTLAPSLGVVLRHVHTCH